MSTIPTSGSRHPNIVRGDMALFDPRDFHAPQSSYTRQDLLRSGQGGYFGPGNAQLPAPPMLMMDRIIEISLDGGEFGKGHMSLPSWISRRTSGFFTATFPAIRSCRDVSVWTPCGRSSVIGLAGPAHRARAAPSASVRFRGDIKPDIKRVRYEVSMRQVRRGKLALGIANGRVFADDACVYLARDMRVGLIASA
jgi:3-hydroxyacyl-[acyl-carrier protein] dehydratase / trans-2-decenoyl-[acyl-carrier protein] isomerase